jgi:hypothetical protein
MSINKFITNLDLSRQAEILSGETAVFQGGIELGIPFSGFPSGVDTSTIVSLGVQEIEYTAFSGGSGTTLFDVVNPSSPYYSVSAATLSASPYTIIDVNTITETVSATTYPTIMTFTALSGDCCSTPISVSFTPPIIQELYDRGLYDGLFNGLGQATIGTTYIDESFYNVGSVFSGANLDMEIIEYGVHGSNPSWSTGTTSGTVIEYSALTQYWVDPIYENLTSGLTLPISPISAETQTSDYVWTLTDSTIIDDNLIGLQYTGYNVTYSFDNVIDDPATQTYIIGGVTATLEYFSAGTLDYKNSIEWLKVRGNATIDERLTTDRLTIHTLGTGSSVTMLGVDVNGNVVGGSGSTTSSYWTSGSSGNYSIKVINDSTTDATGDYAVAEGINTLASGSYSHAEGIGTTASGIKGSHAEGNGTVASGAVSHSQNSNTIAAGNGSHAGGAYSTASGDTSFIHSTNSLVTGDRSVVLGGQNITGTTDDTVYMNKLYVTDPSEGNFYTSLDNAAGAQTVLSGTSDSLSRMSVISPNVGGIGLGVRGESETTYSGYGKQGDGYIYSTTGNNGINIISAAGSGTDDYIKFYAGGDADTLTNSDLMIVGSGSSRGNVGIGTDTPTEKLDVNGNTIVSGTLNIGTLGGGSSVNNLGIDTSGNVVSANTGSFLAAKSPEAIVTHSLTAKGIPDGQVISGYTSIFYNNTDISGTLTTPFGTFDNTTGLFTTNTDCVLNIQAYIHLKANTSSTTAWETGATPTQIGLGICPNNTTDVYVGDFLTILPSVSRGLDITTGITLRVLSGTTFRIKVLNQTSRAYPGAGVVSGDYMRFSITRVD